MSKKTSNIKYVLEYNAVEQYTGSGVWQKTFKGFRVQAPDGVTDWETLPLPFFPAMMMQCVVYDGKAYLFKTEKDLSCLTAPLGSNHTVAINHRGGMGNEFVEESRLVLDCRDFSISQKEVSPVSHNTSYIGGRAGRAG